MDASKMTVNMTFIMLQKIFLFQINVISSKISIHKSISALLFSTLLIMMFLEHHIRMISVGSCAENSTLITATRYIVIVSIHLVYIKRIY